MFSVASPVFSMVTVLAVEVWPSISGSKTRDVGDAEMSGTVPSPVRATLYVPVSGSSEAMARFAVLLPPDVGVKVTFCVQVAKGSRVAPQVVVPLVN